MEQPTGSKLEKDYVKAVYAKLLFFESLKRANLSATCFAHFGSFLGSVYYYVIFKMILQRVA